MQCTCLVTLGKAGPHYNKARAQENELRFLNYDWHQIQESPGSLSCFFFETIEVEFEFSLV